MANFMMLGKYSAQGVSNMNEGRTGQALEAIKKCGGEVKDMHVLLGGPHDIVFIVDMPGVAEAMQASVALTRLTGIQFCTCPALTVREFDSICKNIK